MANRAAYDDNGRRIDRRPLADSPLFDGTPEYIRAVIDAAPPDWVATAEAVVRALAERGEFAADDVWEYLGARRPPEARALGGVLHQMSKAGTIRFTGHFRNSRLPHQHNRPIRIWTKGN